MNKVCDEFDAFIKDTLEPIKDASISSVKEVVDEEAQNYMKKSNPRHQLGQENSLSLYTTETVVQIAMVTLFIMRDITN